MEKVDIIPSYYPDSSRPAVYKFGLNGVNKIQYGVDTSEFNLPCGARVSREGREKGRVRHMQVEIQYPLELNSVGVGVRQTIYFGQGKIAYAGFETDIYGGKQASASPQFSAVISDGYDPHKVIVSANGIFQFFYEELKEGPKVVIQHKPDKWYLRGQNCVFGQYNEEGCTLRGLRLGNFNPQRALGTVHRMPNVRRIEAIEKIANLVADENLKRGTPVVSTKMYFDFLSYLHKVVKEGPDIFSEYFWRELINKIIEYTRPSVVPMNVFRAKDVENAIKAYLEERRIPSCYINFPPRLDETIVFN